MVRADGAVFDVFCEPGLGIKIGAALGPPFLHTKQKAPNSGVAF